MRQVEAIEAIKNHESFLVSTHINPDPDALASELALAMFLKSQKKKVYVNNEERAPARFKFLPGYSLFRKIPRRGTVDFEVAIIVDCGDLNRIGKVNKLITKD